MTRRTVFNRLIMGGLLALTLLLPAQADFISEHYARFETEMRQAAEAYQGEDPEAAYAAYIKARTAQLNFLQDAKKQGISDEEAFLEAHQSMKVDLLRLLTALGGSFHEREAPENALACFSEALKIEPDLPLLHYQTGYLHLLLEHKEAATAHFYEAKRLNRLPIMRWVVNPLDAQFSVGADGPELEIQNDKLLAQLGQPTDYPIERDPASGKTRKNVMIPGMGANLRNAKGESFNLYLNSPETGLYGQLGKAEPAKRFIMPIVQFGPRTSDPNAKPVEKPLAYYPYHEGRVTIALNTSSKQVFMITSEEPGYSLRVHGSYLSIGESADRIEQILGRGYGHQSYNLEGAGVPVMKTYPGLGLVFGVSATGKIAAISIQALE